MNADDDEPFILIGVIQFRDVRQRVDAIDAAICPEVDEDDFAAQIRNAQWVGIEPIADTDKVRRDPLSLGQGRLSLGFFVVGITRLRQSQQTSGRQTFERIFMDFSSYRPSWPFG